MEIICCCCLDGLFGEGEVVTTSCHHVFHSICLNEWIKRSKTCPECRGVLKEPAVRLYFRSEPKESFFKQREEMYQTQIISLRNELDEQKKRFEEQLQAEVQIREVMHNRIKAYEAGNEKISFTAPQPGPGAAPPICLAPPVPTFKTEPVFSFGTASTSGACSSSNVASGSKTFAAPSLLDEFFEDITDIAEIDRYSSW